MLRSGTCSDISDSVFVLGVSEKQKGKKMHGGDIYRNQVNMDFSVNVNPLGVIDVVSKAMAEALKISECYPDLECMELRKALARAFECKTQNILCGNGASELLLSICHALKPRKALLFAPGFSGYNKALEAVSSSISYIYQREDEDFLVDRFVTDDMKRLRPDLMIFSNPCNPTGALMDREQLMEILENGKAMGTTIVVDECFIELTDLGDENSIYKNIKDFPNLIILRAFTKSFAIPGIRLGYLIGSNEKLLEKIHKQLPEWNVSIPAQAAGVAALTQKNFLEETRRVLQKERAFLTDGLKQLGYRVYESKTNFILFQSKDSFLYEKLLQKGILIRDCRDYLGLETGYYRIAVKRHEDNEKLLKKLQEIVHE